MAKKRNKRAPKTRKQEKEPKPKASDTTDAETENGGQDFGGMNVQNFRKNLGCG
jgi:hypothetical protein